MRNRIPSGETNEKYIISGGRKLNGEVRIMSAKNSLLPLIACSVMVNDEVFLSDCERTSDAENMLDIVRGLGGKCHFDNGGICLDCRHINGHKTNAELTGKLRSSVFILGPLLSRMHRADICYPGGCDIGLRPIDLHLTGLSSLGVKFTSEGERIAGECTELKGREVTLPLPSVGATENIIMESVKKGGDRQELHEEIRVHSMEAGRQVKEFGKPNDLLERIAKDPMFGLSEEDVMKLTEPSDYIGRSSQQTEEFIEEYIRPVIEANREYLGKDVDLKV